MAFRIKRIKRSPDPDVKEPAVHYATSLAKEGNVTGWTADPDGAAVFDDAMAPKVKAHYAKRSNAGELKLERAQPKAEPAAESPGGSEKEKDEKPTT